jgi:hypothetical protein
MECFVTFKGKQGVNPVAILKGLLDEQKIPIDKESFDKHELYCYRNKIYANTIMCQPVIDIMTDLLKDFKGYLVFKDGKVYLRSDLSYTVVVNANITPERLTEMLKDNKALAYLMKTRKIKV